jgi:hypothetical protein
MSCFCQQRSQLDADFELPPFSGTKEKTLCTEWLYMKFLATILLWLGAASVVVIKIALKTVFGKLIV